MGGQIRASSELDHGSVFTVILPAPAVALHLPGGHVQPCLVGAVDAVAGGFERAGIGFDGGDVVGHLGRVVPGVGFAAAEAGFLVGPEHDTDGASGSEVQLAQDIHGFHGHDAAGRIIVGSVADVPGVDVAAKDDELVGMG